MVQRKLEFVIGGAQKGGTSTLDSIFRMHPQIQMATVKETHFFDDESHNWEAPDYKKLDACFPTNDGRLRGEATPITLYWRPAIRRLHKYNPNIKFILLLRNPIERAFSHWQHEYARGRETLLFKDAIREKGRSRLDAVSETHPLCRYFTYIERGLYARQLSYLMQYFPAHNIHCEISEELFRNQSAVLQRMSTFLGIDPFPEGISDVHKHAARKIFYPSQLEPRDKAYLSTLFSGDVAEVEALLGRSIPHWRSPIPDAACVRVLDHKVHGQDGAK
jgi:hypothetical protein